MTEADILRIEAALDVSLRPDYREFLLQHAEELRRENDEPTSRAVLHFDPEEIISDNKFARDHPEVLTIGEDEATEVPWPGNHFIVGTNGGGDYWFILQDGSDMGLWFYSCEAHRVERQQPTLNHYLMAQESDKSDDLFTDGQLLAYAEQYTEAMSCFQAAWDLLPEPRDDREMAIQILAAIADCRFYLGAWEKCREAVQHAFRCGADVENTFFRLRLGQSLYELGDEQEAANWLVPVYLVEGRDPFETDDPKYLEFFRRKLQPPEGGWPEGW